MWVLEKSLNQRQFLTSGYSLSCRVWEVNLIFDKCNLKLQSSQIILQRLPAHKQGLESWCYSMLLLIVTSPRLPPSLFFPPNARPKKEEVFASPLLHLKGKNKEQLHLNKHWDMSHFPWYHILFSPTLFFFGLCHNVQVITLSLRSLTLSDVWTLQKVAKWPTKCPGAKCWCPRKLDSQRMWQ